MTVALTIGLLEVLTIPPRRRGLLLLAIGALVAIDGMHGRCTAPSPAGDRQPGKTREEGQLGSPGAGRASARAGRLAGALCGIPGGAYLSGLHILVTRKSSPANQVVGVVLFALIEFSLIITSFASLKLRPEATKAALKCSHDWLLTRARQLIASTALILGAYLTVSVLVELA